MKRESILESEEKVKKYFGLWVHFWKGVWLNVLGKFLGNMGPIWKMRTFWGESENISRK